MPPTTQPYISKSTYLMGLQCQKLLWFRYNAKDQIPAPDEATQAVFDQGKEVGELAHQLFPGGTVVAPGIISPPEVVGETKKAIAARKPLYEAAFSFPGGYARTELPLENIDAIFLSEPLLGRLIGYGAVTVCTLGGTRFKLDFLAKPHLFHVALQRAVSEAKSPARSASKLAPRSQDDSRYMPRC